MCMCVGDYNGALIRFVLQLLVSDLCVLSRLMDSCSGCACVFWLTFFPIRK